MILRRAATALKEQNWTTILIEFVLLVCGVFLGIQVANWNQALADARLGRAYTARLTADLQKDLASRREIVAYYRAVLDSVERTDALLADPQSDPKALLINAYRASEVTYRASSNATWSEIVSSGDTGLLPPELARNAGEYFAIDTARVSVDLLTGSAYRHRVRSIIPLRIDKALRTGCSDTRDGAQEITGFMQDCTLDIDTGLVSKTAAALRDDPAVHAELRHHYSGVYSAHANISGNVVKIERALATVNGPTRPTEALP